MRGNARHGIKRLTAIVAAAASMGAGPQPGPPVHDVGAVIATSSLTFLNQSQLFSPQTVVLSDGRVLVSDRKRRAVLLLDPSLRNATTVLDSAAGRANSYRDGIFIMPFRGDSSFFYDASAKALVVIAPNGEIGRVLAKPPTPTAPPFYVNPYMPVSATALGIVYKVSIDPRATLTASGSGGVERVVVIEDSSQVLRMDYASRRTDTLARIDRGSATIYHVKPDVTTIELVPALLEFYDEIVATTDGGVAIFHAREYRVERIGPNGRVSGHPTTYPWQPISDADKAGIVDSVSAARRHAHDSSMAKRAADSARTGSPPMGTAVSTTEDGVRVERRVPIIPAPPPRVPAVGEIPDFRPPTGRSAVKADADNNVWVRTNAFSTASQEVWDVIDAEGTVIDRVRIPPHALVVGFAPGGRVLLFAVEGTTGVFEMARVR